MSWHGNGYRLSSGRGWQRIVTFGLAAGFGLLGVLGSSGCAIAPGVTATGLPKLGRYASPAQLDWMLGRYALLGQTTPGGDEELREEACLGWERAVFDLQSGRRYPMLLRMSNETTNLASLWQDLPLLARRHPRPSSCDDAAGSAAVIANPPVIASGSPATVPVPAVSQTPPSDSPPVAQEAAGQSVTPPGVAVAANAAPTAPVAPVDSSASASPSAPQPVGPVAASAESLVIRQRRQLTRLRVALGMPIEPSARDGESANPGSARLEPAPDRKAPPSPDLDDAALQVLTELAESDLPPVRLRARFHLLGLCTLAVEASDRYLFDPPAGAPVSEQESALNQAGRKVCGLRSPKESLRRGQSRLLWSLLRAWRVKYPEPMGDIVIGLASFASRDNPVVDGPRVAR